MSPPNAAIQRSERTQNGQGAVPLKKSLELMAAQLDTLLENSRSADNALSQLTRELEAMRPDAYIRRTPKQKIALAALKARVASAQVDALNAHGKQNQLELLVIKTLDAVKPERQQVQLVRVTPTPAANPWSEGMVTHRELPLSPANQLAQVLSTLD